jgi:hypothetical protein
MTNEELTKYSDEHLLYEITMFWWLSGAIWYTDGYMHDSLLESWVGHLRNLINFLCRPRQQDDLIAGDFFDNPGAWPQSESDKRLPRFRLKGRLRPTLFWPVLPARGTASDKRNRLRPGRFLAYFKLALFVRRNPGQRVQ